jgi:hypothetical protein
MFILVVHKFSLTLFQQSLNFLHLSDEIYIISILYTLNFVLEILTKTLEQSTNLEHIYQTELSLYL